MFDHQEMHPSNDRILDFAEGLLANARDIESHIDHCDECAEAVLIARRLHCLVQQNLIPPLNADERKQEKDRLRRLLQPEIQGESVRRNPRSPDSAIWASLGAIGGTLGLGGGITGPKPMLAGTEGPITHPGTTPHKTEDGTKSSDGHHSAGHGNSENSEHSPVTNADDLPSSHQKRSENNHDEVSELLDQMQELLDPPDSKHPIVNEHDDMLSTPGHVEHHDDSTHDDFTDHDAMDAGGDHVADVSTSFDDATYGDTHHDHDDGSGLSDHTHDGFDK